MTAVVALLLISLAGYSEGKAANSQFVWKTPQYLMPWTKGPNVCAVEEVQGSRQHYYSECMTYIPRQICGKSTFIRYHCCTGYEQTAAGEEGCRGVAPVENLADTIKHLYLKEFKSLVKGTQYETTFRDGMTPAHTVFVPSNAAFRALTPEQRRQLGFGSRGPGTADLVGSHTVTDRFPLKDLTNDLTLSSLGGEDIRINRYANGIVTANCARVVVPDQMATNGIVHTTEKVVMPFKARGTILDQLTSQTDHSFDELLTALRVTGLHELLEQQGARVTLFAPTDAAFQAAPAALMQRLLSDVELLKRLLKYHVVSEEICTTAILTEAKVTSLEGQKLNLTCAIDDAINVNDVKLAAPDVVTTNGVIHVIDKLLIPDSVRCLEDILIDMEMFEFLEYLQGAGLQNILCGTTPGNYTLFVPSNDVIQGLTLDERRSLQTSESKRVFRYHVIEGRVTTSSVVGNSVMTSMAGPQDTLLLFLKMGDIGSSNISSSPSSSLRQVRGGGPSNCGANETMGLKPSGFSVNEAQLISANHEAYNGVIHVIDRLMTPPEGDVTVEIRRQSDVSTFQSLLQTTTLVDELQRAEITVFAPTNDAFNQLPREQLSRIKKDPQELEKFLRYHVVSQPISLAAQQGKWQYRYQTLAGEWVNATRELREETSNDVTTHVIINHQASTIGSPRRASNGLVYVIDGVLHCPSPCSGQPTTRPRGDLERDPYGDGHHPRPTDEPDVRGRDNDRATEPPLYPRGREHDRATESPLYPRGRENDRATEPPVYPQGRDNVRVTDRPIYPQGRENERVTKRPRYPTTSTLGYEEFTLSPYATERGPRQNELDTSSNDVMELLQMHPDMSDFQKLIQVSDVDDIIYHSRSKITLFVPSNRAMAEMDRRMRTSLDRDSVELDKFVRYHILEHPIYLDMMQEDFPYGFKTMVGPWLDVHKSRKSGREEVFVNEYVRIERGPIEAENAVIYTVDRVLVCPCLDVLG